MKWFNVIQQDLEVCRHYFLEASAGTGKTFSIEHLVTRLILEGIPLEKILLVTFTKAATRDLQHRVLSNLKAVLKLLEEKSQSPFEYVNQILVKGEENIFKSLLLLKKAIHCEDKAQIFTIHGFCYKMLTEFSLEAGVSLKIFDPDQVSVKGYYIEKTIEILRNGIDDNVIHPKQIYLLQKKYKKDFISLISSLVNYISLDKKIIIPSSFEELRNRFCEVIKTDPISCETLLNFMPIYKGLSNEKDEQSRIDQLEAIKELDGHALFLSLLDHTTPILSCIKEENRRVNAKISPSDLGAIQLLEKACERWMEVINKAKNPYNLELLLSSYCQEQLKKIVAQEDLIMMDQLLLKMHGSLGNKNFKDLVRNKYMSVIIDEFQDTDPLQWNIFSDLFLSKEYTTSSFVVVGDPKQSIYAFRNADLDTYFRAKQSFDEEHVFALPTNYRSNPKLIENLNFLFSKMPNWFDYYLVTAGKKKNDLITDGKGSVCFFGCKDIVVSRETSFPSKNAEEKKFFPFITNEIIQLVKSGVSFDEITILVKDRYQARTIEKYLRSANIPVISNAKENIVNSNIYAFFSFLFLCLESPNDLSLIKQLLSLGIIDFDKKVLSEKISHSFFQEIVSFLRKGMDILYSRGLSSFLQYIFYERIHPNVNSLYIELVSKENLDLYNDAVQLIQLFLENCKEDHVDIGSLIDFMTLLHHKSIEETKFFYRRPSKEGSCVTIMTTFNSKGLEFGVVFAYGIISRINSKSEIYYSQSNKAFTTVSVSEDEVVNSKLHYEKEKLRQLYVALTRAKRRVYIPFCFQEDGKTPSLGKAAPLDLFYSSLITQKTEITDLYQGISEVSFENFKDFCTNNLNDFSIQSIDEIQLDSYRASEEKNIELIPPRPLIINDRVVDQFSFSTLFKGHKKKIRVESHYPSGAEVGTILHSLFEKISQLGWFSSLYKNERSFLIKKQLASSILSQHVEETITMIEDTINLKFPDNFTLADLDPSKVLQEVEFIYELENKKLMKGFMDFVFFHDEKYHIVDWKSNLLTGYKKMDLHEEMVASSYLIQGSIYRTALEKYLSQLQIDISNCFGGVHYVFLRGPAMYSFQPKPFQMEVAYDY